MRLVRLAAALVLLLLLLPLPPCNARKGAAKASAAKAKREAKKAGSSSKLAQVPHAVPSSLLFAFPTFRAQLSARNGGCL